MSEDTEVTLKQFIGSIWFKGLSRVGVFVLLPFVGFLLSENNQLRARIDLVENTIIATEERNRIMDKVVTDMKTDVATINTKVDTMNGKLSTLLRQASSDALAPDWLYEGILPSSPIDHSAEDFLRPSSVTPARP